VKCSDECGKAVGGRSGRRRGGGREERGREREREGERGRGGRGGREGRGEGEGGSIVRYVTNITRYVKGSEVFLAYIFHSLKVHGKLDHVVVVRNHLDLHRLPELIALQGERGSSKWLKFNQSEGCIQPLDRKLSAQM